MLKKIGSAMNALAIFLTIIVSIDYFCQGCLLHFLGTPHAPLVLGLLAGITVVLLIRWAIVFLFQKFNRNQYDIDEPEGQVLLNSPFYIERPPIESECYRLVLKPDALIRIKAPRQMGKTSLMTRILHHAEQQSYRTINLSFQGDDSTIFANLDHFLQSLCRNVTEQLGLVDKVDEYWQSKRVNSKRCCSKYFKQYLLTEITQPLVLGLDEVDMIFQEAFATDFFGLLRTWYENGKNDPDWKRLHLILTYSQEVYISLKINQSPFNVGKSFELPEFNAAQVQRLLQRHKLAWTEAQIEELMALVGGHPYLVRLALYNIARGELCLEQLLKIADKQKGPYADHLGRHLNNLQQHPELEKVFKSVITTNEGVSVAELGQSFFKLKGMGLLKIDDDDQVIVSCELYRRYFKSRL